MSGIFSILAMLVFIYVLFLLARLVVDWIRVLSRDFRPRGLMAALLEIIYTVTDPPLKALRRLLPPIRLGNVGLDLSLPLLLIVCWLLIQAFTMLSLR